MISNDSDTEGKFETKQFIWSDYCGGDYGWTRRKKITNFEEHDFIWKVICFPKYYNLLNKYVIPDLLKIICKYRFSDKDHILFLETIKK